VMPAKATALAAFFNTLMDSLSFDIEITRRSIGDECAA